MSERTSRLEPWKQQNGPRLDTGDAVVARRIDPFGSRATNSQCDTPPALRPKLAATLAKNAREGRRHRPSGLGSTTGAQGLGLRRRKARSLSTFILVVRAPQARGDL